MKKIIIVHLYVLINHTFFFFVEYQLLINSLKITYFIRIKYILVFHVFLWQQKVEINQIQNITIY